MCSFRKLQCSFASRATQKKPHVACDDLYSWAFPGQDENVNLNIPDLALEHKVGRRGQPKEQHDNAQGSCEFLTRKCPPARVDETSVRQRRQAPSRLVY